MPFSPLRRRSLLFLAFFVVIVWPLLFLLQRPTLIARWAFEPIVTSDAFHAGQWGQPEPACSSLVVRRHLDLLVVGSSHVYRGIDMHALASAYPGQDVGVCAWPTWDSTYFEPLLAFLDRWGVTVDRLVWITDVGAFRPGDKGALREFRRSFETYLGQTAGNGPQLLEWVARSLLSSAPLGVAFNDYRQMLENQAIASASLNPDTIRTIVASHHLPDEERVLADARQFGLQTSQGVQTRLKQVCPALDPRGTGLDVVIYPIPGTTLDMMSEALGIALPNLAAEIRRGLPCLDRLVDEPMEDWGLDLRHFVNLDVPHATEIWSDPDLFSQRFAGLPVLERNRLFDADHLNRLGARIFTGRLVTLLKTADGGPSPALPSSAPGQGG